MKSRNITHAAAALGSEQGRSIHDVQSRIAALFPSGSSVARMVRRHRFVQYDKDLFCEKNNGMREDSLCKNVAQVEMDHTIFLDYRLLDVIGHDGFRLIVAHEIAHAFDRPHSPADGQCYHFLTDATALYLLARAKLYTDPPKISPHLFRYLHYIEDEAHRKGTDLLCHGRSRAWYLKNCAAPVAHKAR